MMVWVNISDIDKENYINDDACNGTTIEGTITASSWCISIKSCLFANVIEILWEIAV